MKIIKLSIENYRGIKLLKLDNVGKFTTISGKNGVGKSSILDAIESLFKSEGVNPNRIKKDTDKAELFVQLDNGVSIQRRMTNTANIVKVVENGKPVSSPQSFLDKISGPLNFKPIQFFLLGKGKTDQKRQQKEMLLNAMPIYLSLKELVKLLGEMKSPIDLNKFDYSKHALVLVQEIQDAIRDTRTEKNRDVTRITKSIEQSKRDMPPTFDPDKYKDFNIGKKINDLTEAKSTIKDHDSEKKKLDYLRDQANEKAARIESLKKELENTEADLEKINITGKDLKTKIEAFVCPDIETLQKDVDDYDKARNLIIKLEDIKRREGELIKAKAEHEELDKFYKFVANEIPRKVLATANLPIEGLEFRGDDTYVNGVSLEELSTSEKLTFSANFGKALCDSIEVNSDGKNESIKFICLDGWESVDTDNRKRFMAQAEPDKYQYFLTDMVPGQPLKVETTGDLKVGSNPADSTGESPAKEKGSSHVVF